MKAVHFSQKTLLLQITNHILLRIDARMMHWWCTGDALMMRGWCARDLLLIHRWYTCDARKMHGWCTDDARMMHCWCNADAMMMHDRYFLNGGSSGCSGSTSETLRMESLTFFSFSLDVRCNLGILVLVPGDGSQDFWVVPVSYTHLTLPTTPYV